MKKRLGFGLIGLGLAGYTLYRLRRSILAQLLRLPPVRSGVRVERSLPVPMPDGVHLMADHYAPTAEGDFPTLLIRSPYGRGPEAGAFGYGFVFLAQRFAERGYHVVVQGVRGLYDSEGEFAPFVHEAADGLATVEWIAGQPWFNGVLGMWGPSYLGYNQYAVAVNAPPGLRAIAPSVAFSSVYPLTYSNGALALDTALQGLFLFDTLRRYRQSPQESGRRWRVRREVMDQAFSHLPLLEADTTITGRAEPFYRNTLGNVREDDPFWKDMDHRERLNEVAVPVHLLGGWYDLCLKDTLADYAALRAAGHRPHLVIGPWYHLDLSPKGWLPAALREGLRWFDAHLKGETHRLRRQPVRIYVMGAEEWQELEDWPPAAETVRYYLHAQDQLSTGGPTTSSPPDAYLYDPADPTPNLAGPLLMSPAGPVDNRALEARSDVLCYTTTPLERDVEVIGPVRLELYVRSSLAHTDFFGRLCDVYPDGRSVNVCDGLFRVEPGKGELQPDGSLRIEVDLSATAQCFRRGHCIRLQVSSGAHPRWNRNLGTAEPSATATAMVAAEQTIYHDPRHPSALVLPISRSP